VGRVGPVTVALGLDDLGLAGAATSELSADHTARIGATIDAPHTPVAGEPLPLLWHWGHFTPTTPTAGLGPDGHPRLPNGPLSAYPRRMWASGTVDAPGQLIVGQPAHPHLSDHRGQGVGGTLGCAPDRPARAPLPPVRGRSDRRGADTRLPHAGPPVPLPVGDHHPELAPEQWGERHLPDNATLFRFSAVTFNSHRIHYDDSYATTVEGYPALVVHGPLTAVLVGQSLRHHLACDLSRFEFRATAPLFVGLPFTIVGTGTPAPGARVIRNDGTESMTVSATLAG